ncbi:ABC transporter ATP-binding protein [Kitasatospora phosalacinea]|uniref:ABC transporter ATP-binding protein n=1 Tax=Kitasatospora phosalacinea TaxID=2065 RepID=UPI000526307D|nr:ABC transporter ATP-binding protein [Kitasatospora phosalacinea]
MTLHIEGVHKAYGDRPVLRGVDLRIEPGEVTGLLGLNGAGKSTLVTIVAGLLPPDAGRVLVGGVDVGRHPHRARAHLGLAPQDLGIYPSVTVRDNLTLFGRLAGLRGARLRERIDKVADALELEKLFDRQGRALSGGEQRRLHTALAMLHEPRLLLLDEPTVGVDVATRSRLLQAVRDLAADGAAIGYSTHYLAELDTLRATVAILHEGTIVRRGTLAELVDTHGRAAVDLTFTERVPDGLDFGPDAVVRGATVRLPSSDPAKTAAEALGLLGAHGSAVRSVELVRPDLETVFLSITGHLPQEVAA